MYLQHFGLIEHPFRITPHTEFFFSGANRGATLDALLYAITHDEGIVKVTGEVGSGKTMLCRVLLERLPEKVITVYLATPSLTRDDFLYTLAIELGLSISETARTAQILRAIQDKLIQLYGEGRQVVVLIDEAHVMPAETLEEIRLLSNLESNRHKLLKIVLFGQPELNDLLGQTHMRQLKERITHNFALEPLVTADISEYLNFRLRAAGYHGPSLFAPPAIKLISHASMGLTRRINILADKALLSAFSKGSHDINEATIHAAIRDCEFSAPPKATTPIKVPLTLLLLLGVVGLGVFTYLNTAEDHAPPAPPIAPTPLATEVPEVVATTEPAPAPPAIEHPLAPKLELPIEPLAPIPDKTMARLVESQSWLKQTDDERWFVQMLATDIDSVDVIDGFLSKVDKQLPPGDTRIYLVPKGKSQKIGLIHGDFPSQRAAQDFINKLPPNLKNNQPYARPVRHLR